MTDAPPLDLDGIEKRRVDALNADPTGDPIYCNDVPALISEVERLRKQIAEAKAILQNYKINRTVLWEKALDALK
jgi:hypothetical protein